MTRQFEASVPYGLDHLQDSSDQEIAIRINGNHWLKVPGTDLSNFNFNINHYEYIKSRFKTLRPRNPTHRPIFNHYLITHIKVYHFNTFCLMVVICKNHSLGGLMKKSILILSLALLSLSTYANESIKLVHAQIDQACSSCGSLSGSIKLRNINYEKHVDVFYQAGIDNEWHSIPATFSSLDSKSNEEVWNFRSGSLSSLLVGKTQFAIRYEVEGTVYWDNNCDENYTLDISNSSTLEVTGHACQ